MKQLKGFIAKNQEHMECKWKRSIYRLKQSSRSWNIKFDQAIKSFGFEKNLDEPCVCKRHQDNVVMSSVKIWLSSQFDMKNLGEASYILGIKLWQDRKNRIIGLSQAGFIDKILARFSMQNFKKGLLPFRHGVHLSDDQRPKTSKEERMMRQIPYASVMGSLVYAMLCTRLDICYSIGMISQYQLNPRPKHWEAVKHILKYLRRAKEYMLVYYCKGLIPTGYIDSNFQ